MKKKVLLIGTSFSAVPLFQELRGDYIISVCGGLKDDPCHKYADKSFYIDYSNKEKLLQLCIDEKFDFIVPSCNDYAYNSASYVATKLNKYNGFDSYETTLLLHTKNAFRNFLLKNNLPSPKVMHVNKDLEYNTLDMKFPLLVKPDDSFSGKGITKINIENELDEAIQIAIQASKNDKIVIEEFVEGTLHSHSAFIQNGEIIIDFFVDEYCSVYPYQVDSSSLSVILTSEIKKNIRSSIEKIATLLDLKNGLLHTQLISNENRFWLIETMRRCPGDLYGLLIEKSTSFKYSEFYSNPFLNKKNELNTELNNKFVARHTISVREDIIYQSFQENIPSENVDIFTLKESGQVLKKAPLDKAGIIFSEFKNKNELKSYTKKMKEFITVQGVQIDFKTN